MSAVKRRVDKTPPSRRGKVASTYWMAPPRRAALKAYAAAHHTTVDALMDEAIEALFQAKGIGMLELVGNKGPRADRVGRVNLTVYMDPAAKASFRLIQAQYPGRTLHDLIADAFDDFFSKHGVPQTAKLR